MAGRLIKPLKNFSPTNFPVDPNLIIHEHWEMIEDFIQSAGEFNPQNPLFSELNRNCLFADRGTMAISDAGVLLLMDQLLP